MIAKTSPLSSPSATSKSVHPPRPPSPDFDPLSLGDDLAELPVYKAAGTQSIDFDGLLEEKPLLLHEDLAGGCGGQLWPAGMVLSKYMLREHREDLKEGTIVELGAGGGLVGLAVALGCQFKAPLFITDQIPMFELMKQNIALNSLESTVSPLIWDWGQPMPAPLLASPPSIVLAADCVYFEPAFPLLIQTLKDLFEANVECRVFFCFKKRRSADKQFMKMARKLFTITDIEDQDKPVWSREQLFLHEFRKKEVKSGASSKATSGMSTPL